MRNRFLKYVLQSMAGMIGISFYILADTYFIAQCEGADGLAVLNLIIPVFGIMFAIGAMVGIGSATRYALHRANQLPSEHCFGQSLAWSLLFSLGFVLLGLFFPKEMIGLLGADDTLTTLGTPYLRIILLAAPFFLTNYTFTAFVRNNGRPGIAMAGSICGSLFNIVFDYLLMFSLGLGLTGAALATAISPLVTILVCLSHFRSAECHISLKWSPPQPRYLLDVCGLGTPAFVGEISAAVTTLTFNALILSAAGNIGVAAYGVVANIALVVLALYNGIAQGVQPLISGCNGCSADKERFYYLGRALALALAFALLTIGVSSTATAPVIALFNPQGNALLSEYATVGLRLYPLGFLPASVNIIVLAYYAAIGRDKPAIIGSMLRGLVCIIGCAVILAKLFGMNGIWLSLAASELITMLVLLVMQLKKPRKTI